MSIEILESDGYQYIETDQKQEQVLLLLHGLFGALSNFMGLIEYFKDKINVVVPILPIYELPLKETGLGGLVKFVENFIKYKGYEKVNLLGNSLGGHIAQLYTIAAPEKVRSLILTGSSGLFESGMGNTFPRRGSYEYIKKKSQSIFYDPAIATKELVDEVFNIVNDRNKALKIVVTAKSAVRHNLGDKLHQIKAPSLLVWGQQDQVTPPFVAEKFHELIKSSELVFLDKCGHAPMMEKPDEFNHILEGFLKKLDEKIKSSPTV